MAVKENRAGRLDHHGLLRIEAQIASVQQLLATIPCDGALVGGLAPRLEMRQRAEYEGFGMMRLLVGTGEDRFRGSAKQLRTPPVIDMLRLPSRDEIVSVDGALLAMRTCHYTCVQLLNRAAASDTNSSSRLIMQRLVTQLFYL